MGLIDHQAAAAENLRLVLASWVFPIPGRSWV